MNCFHLRDQALKKTFKKLDHDVNIQDFLGTRYAMLTLLGDCPSIDLTYVIKVDTETFFVCCCSSQTIEVPNTI